MGIWIRDGCASQNSWGMHNTKSEPEYQLWTLHDRDILI